jgi:serine/threonine protein kinase
VAPEILTATAQSGYKNVCDVFSVGVVMFILLCGYEPFYGETDKEVVEANKKGADGVEFSEAVWDEVSEDARVLIKSLLNKDPETRITSGEALRHVWFDGCDAKRLFEEKEKGELERTSTRSSLGMDSLSLGSDRGSGAQETQDEALFRCTIL